MRSHRRPTLLLLLACLTTSALQQLRPALRSTPLAAPLRGAATAFDEEEEFERTAAQVSADRRKLEFKATKYFFGRVEVFLGNEYKPLSETVDPSYSDDSTAVSSVVVPAPYGMILEESATLPGRVEVVELVAGSNAELAGVAVGDILRGTTAMAMNIQESSEEDFGFSIGLTEGSRQRAYLPTDRKRFDLIMAALKSNALDNGGPGEACLVFERKVKEPEPDGDE